MGVGETGGMKVRMEWAVSQSTNIELSCVY